MVHSRLSHTLEVAQIARRIAERLIHDESDLVQEVGGLDPDVAEAAALAHDLGHPPFGHVAERALYEKAQEHGDLDGFEGNAQSFRIVTRLAARRLEPRGLDLTRATLNGMLKYPRGSHVSGVTQEKWGVYQHEKDIFDWVRKSYPQGSEVRSLEAEIMDWADDIAYSVHDIADLYRLGLIPLDRLRNQPAEFDDFLATFRRRRMDRGGGNDTDDDLRAAFSRATAWFPITRPFDGSRIQRATLNAWAAELIDRYASAIGVNPDYENSRRLVRFESEQVRQEVRLLKDLTRYFRMNHPALTMQQHGQGHLIGVLFDAFLKAASEDEGWSMFPKRFQEQRDEIGSRPEETPVRVVTDLIVSMTEEQAITVYSRLMGESMEPILKPFGL